MSSKAFSQVSSLSTLEDKSVDKQAFKEENLHTLKREEKVLMTSNGDVQYDVKHLTKVTVPHQPPRGDTKDDTATCREQVTRTTQKWDTIAQKTPI